MLLTRQHTSSLLALSLGIIIFVHKIKAQPNDNWIVMEQLAEEYPFVVALLNAHRQFVCTGTIIHSQAVLTSGECVTKDPLFVAVAVTVISPLTVLNLLEVTETVLHEDYLYYFNPGTPNSTKIFSNIGLVIVKSPPLDKFVVPGVLADYLDVKLKDATLSVVGFATNWTRKVLLMESVYQQVPCYNLQWYNVFCGKQFKHPQVLVKDFAKGGPILFESKVVGVVAAPTGALVTSDGVKFTVFTLTAPYLTWIVSNLYEYSPPYSEKNVSQPAKLVSQSYQYKITPSSFSESCAICALTKCYIILSCIMILLNHF